MQIKDYGARFKAHKDAEGNPTGEVTAIVSVFGNVDLVGDRVVKGAFADSLAQWKDSGDPIPMLWSHDWSNPLSHIGAWDASKAVETDEGLELTGTVDIGTGNPVADQAYKLMSNRLVREFSFAYDVLDEAPAKDGANELLSLSLIEAGPTLKGANSETRLIAAKALLEQHERELVKAGRVISAKNEATLRDAQIALKAAGEAIGSVLAAVEEKAKAKDGATAVADADVDAELEQEPDGTSEVDELDDDKTNEPEPITAEQAAASAAQVLAFLTDTEVELVLGTDDGDHV